MSVTRITPRNFKRHLHQLQIDVNTHTEIQKAVILKTCNIARAFLNTQNWKKQPDLEVSGLAARKNPKLIGGKKREIIIIIIVTTMK